MKECWCGYASMYATLFYRGIYESALETVAGKIVQCDNCKTIYTEEWEMLEQKGINDGIDYYDSIKKSRRHQNSKLLVDTFMNGGNLLEIGCGYGSFLQFVSELDKYNHCVGIDKTKFWDKDKNGKCVLKHMEIDGLHEVFDDIIVVHCLEHVEKVKEFFSSMKKNLHEGSRVYICVPNVHAYKRYTINRNGMLWCNFGAFGPHEHCWHFSTESLSRMVLSFFEEARIIHLGTSALWGEDEQVDIIFEV